MVSDSDLSNALGQRRRAPPGGVTRRIMTANGGTIRTVVWQPEHSVCGAIILLHGRGEFIEKYHETIADFLHRGWAVFSFDWQGQGLSSRLLRDPYKAHIDDFIRYEDDLQRFMTEVVAKTGSLPRIAIAHSFGALVTLHYARKYPDAFTKMVLLAPMISLALPRFLPAGLASFLVKLICLCGFSDTYLPGRPGDYLRGRPFEGNRLTSDPKRFKDVEVWITAQPGLAVGGPTFGWLRAAFRSMEAAAEPSFAAAMKTPTLILCAGDDSVVDIKAQENLAQKMPVATLIKISGAKHEILKERDDIRNLALSLIDRFITPNPQ
ncbi:MAG: alpha/beta hydrolase [Alphaproteobacteria bacterium]